MKMNINELQKWIYDNDPGHDITKEVKLELFYIVETAKKFIAAKRICYSNKSTIEDYHQMNQLEIELSQALKDVEI